MPNLVDDLRLRSMFSKLFNPSTEANSVSDSTDDSVQMPRMVGMQSQPSMDIDKLFPMQHEASDRLKQVLDTMPQRDQFQPSKFQRVMAGIAGMGAGHPSTYSDGAALGFTNNPKEQMEVTQSRLNEPYNKAVSDWELKLKPLQELATAERYNNSNERIARNNYLQNESRDRADETRRRGQDLQLQGRQEAIAQRDRHDTVINWRNQHPNYIYKTDSNGHMYAIEPKTNQMEYLKTPDGEMIESDKLPEELRLDKQHQNKISEQNNSEANTQKDIAARGEEARTTKATTPGKNLEPVKTPDKPTTGKPTASAKRVKVYNEKGEPGTIPESDLPRAIKQGYTVR